MKPAFTRVNGRAIEDYRDFNVREDGLALPRSEPLYTPAIQNGYRQHDIIVDDSLVLNLPLYRLKGATFNSVDRNQIACANIGPLWQPDGHLFDGINDEIDCGDNTALDVTAAITLEAFYKVGKTGLAQDLVSRDDPVNRNFFMRQEANEIISLVMFIGGVLKFQLSANPVTLANWFHLVATYDQVDMRIYINGILDGVPTLQAGAIDNDDVSLKLGDAGVGSGFLQATYGEFRMYNRALSPDEIAHNFAVISWRGG